MEKYKFSITLKKAGMVFIEILIAGSFAYVTETPELIFLAPVLEGLRNYWKNRNKKKK